MFPGEGYLMFVEDIRGVEEKGWLGVFMNMDMREGLIIDVFMDVIDGLINDISIDTKEKLIGWFMATKKRSKFADIHFDATENFMWEIDAIYKLWTMANVAGLHFRLLVLDNGCACWKHGWQWALLPNLFKFCCIYSTLILFSYWMSFVRVLCELFPYEKRFYFLVFVKPSHPINQNSIT